MGRHRPGWTAGAVSVKDRHGRELEEMDEDDLRHCCGENPLPKSSTI